MADSESCAAILGTGWEPGDSAAAAAACASVDLALLLSQPFCCGTIVFSSHSRTEQSSGLLLQQGFPSLTACEAF